MLARLLPITFLLALVCAATSQAATVKVPVPAEGQVAVVVAKVSKKAKVKLAQAPAAVAVSGSAKRGRLAIAVTRPRGWYGAGAVSVKVRGGKAKSVRRFVAAVTDGSAPRAACKTLGTLLAKPLQTGGITAGDLKVVGGAVAARLCGKPAPGAAAGVLARLGLGSTPGGGGLNPGGGGNHTPPPPPPSGPTNQCSNGIDDDHDGQVDALSERKLRPDPGCMNANDPTEAGEVPVAAACAASSGVSVGDEPSQLNVGINGGCGSFVEAAVYAQPSAFVCDIQAWAGNWVCVIDHGQPFADTRNATAADMADLQIGLNGPANCAVPATVVLYRSDFTVAELVEPIQGCGEVSPPAGCIAELSTFNGDSKFVGVAVSGCGSIKGVQFTPSATPSDCFVQVGADPATTCSVAGAAGSATFAPTSQEVLLAMHTAVDPPCGPVTTVITLANGAVVKIQDNWC
ncbi:MAG TPA: hypothetical protein VFX51_21060 [Solirubrobacteraceae bacterium]|nr:hypothetical protein [Solirubrobacteraceae bacterium]